MKMIAAFSDLLKIFSEVPYIDKSKIRANQGHSIAIDLDLVPQNILSSPKDGNNGGDRLQISIKESSIARAFFSA
jgi:RNA:NAD 2'-phosphotransferase (TPT1/KptA family)